MNWYLNDYVRLMFDYAEADLSGYPLTAVASARPSHSTHLPQLPVSMAPTVRGFGMRAQVDW